jgi:hypothetical protein
MSAAGRPFRQETPWWSRTPFPMQLDLRFTDRFFEGLIVLFYAAISLALLATLLGSPGWGFLFLLFGAAGLVLRTTIEIQQHRPRQSPPPSANR